MKNYHNNLEILLSIVAIIGFISCKKEQVTVRKIELAPTESKQIKLSQIFSKADIFNFNINDIMYAKPEKMVVKDDLYYMQSKKTIVVCNSNGDLILNLSKRGKGPGEYIDIADFQVGENGNILINDREGRKMIMYNLQGECINVINHSLLSYNFIKINDKIYLNSGNLINVQSEYRVNVWDEATNSLEQGFIKQEKELGYLSVMEYTNFSFFSDTLSYSQSFSNTIYQLVNNQAIPRLDIDFGKHNLPENYTKRYTDLRSLMENFWKSEYASRLDGYREGNNYLFFSYTYHDKHPFFWLSKMDDHTYHFDKFEDDFLFPGVIQETDYKSLPIFIDENCVYISIEAYHFIELYDKIKTNDSKWENQILMEKIYSQINEDSNALIIRYKIKQ